LGALVGNTARSFLAIVVLMAVLFPLAIHSIPAWSALSGRASLVVWLVTGTGLALLLVQNLLVGRFRFVASNLTELVARLGMIAGTLALWWAGIRTALSFGCIITVFTGAAVLWGLRAGGIRIDWREWSPPLWWKQMSVGGRAYVACIASFALGRVPLYAVESRGGLEGVAFFTQALNIADTMLVFPIALGTVVFPSMASTREAHVRIRSTLRLAGITAGLMLLAAGAAAWLGPLLLPALYGKAYAASMPILLAMLPGVAALGVCSVVQNALSANGYPWAAVASPVAGLLAVCLGLRATDTVVGCGHAYSLGAVVMLASSSAGWWFHRHDWTDIALPPAWSANSTDPS
jgi:O-antigen/teichoic acid export membrane protein